MQSSQRTGSSTIRNGLLFGVIIVAVYIANEFIQDITGTTVALVTIGSAFRPLSLLNQASLIVAVVLFFVVGLRTARAEDKLSSAVIAGLIAALMVTAVEIGTLVVNQRFLYSTTIATLAAHKQLALGGWNYVFLDTGSGSGSLLMIIIYTALGTGVALIGGIFQMQLRQEALWR